MKLGNLRAFVHVMNEGSLVAAAERMNLSQPAASRLIHLLEEEAGTQLFYRDQKTLTPTPEAELFYAEARHVIDTVDGFPDLFRQFRDNSLVPLRVICQARVATGLIIPAIQRFCREHPGVHLLLDIDELHPRRAQSRRHLKGRFDVGVYVVPMPADDMRLIERFELRIHAVLPRAHRLASREVLRPEDMAGECYIAPHRGLRSRDAIDQALARSGRQLMPFHEVSSTAAALRLVAGEIGFTLADRTVVDPLLANQIVMVPWEPAITVDVGFYTPPKNKGHMAAGSFLQHLRARLASASGT